MTDEIFYSYIIFFHVLNANTINSMFFNYYQLPTTDFIEHQRLYYHTINIIVWGHIPRVSLT
jgi:hypothetical protein